MMPGGRPSRMPLATSQTAGPGAPAAHAIVTAVATQPTIRSSRGRFSRSANRPPSGTERILIQSATPVMAPASPREAPRVMRKLGAKLATTITLAFRSAQPAPALIASAHTRPGMPSWRRADSGPVAVAGWAGGSR